MAVANFGYFRVEMPAPVAVAIARLDEEKYARAVIDRALIDLSDLRNQVESISDQDLREVLNKHHVGDHGDDLDRRCRLIYLAARQITNYLKSVGSYPVMSRNKYDNLRAAYQDFLEYHLRHLYD